MKSKIIAFLISCLFLFSGFSNGWIDDGTSKKQTIKIKDLDTGKSKKVKYRIYGVNRDRIKVYTEDGIKKYKIKKKGEKL